MKTRYMIETRIQRAAVSRAAMHSVATPEEIASPPKPRAAVAYVDFDRIQPSHWAMHDRLENWARASRGGDKQAGNAGPMFVLYRSSDARREYGAETAAPVDRSDAVIVGKGVSFLPDKHRQAIHWFYLHPRNPKNAASLLGVTMQGLADLVRDGRQMLINRGV